MATTSDEIEGKASEIAIEDTGKTQAASWDSETEKKLRRKCDRHVLPCITLLFFMSFLDRTNIGEQTLLRQHFGWVQMQSTKKIQQVTRGSKGWCKTLT